MSLDPGQVAKADQAKAGLREAAEMVMLIYRLFRTSCMAKDLPWHDCGSDTCTAMDISSTDALRNAREMVMEMAGWGYLDD